MARDRSKPRSLAPVLILFLLGIFMGAIDTGIVTPARTLIQTTLGADEKTGIWMITIYTLAYAAIIPISGKLADRYGRKLVYLLSIGLFGLGSLICALSAATGLFWVLLAGRVVQALGGGGIVPVATAEFGTTFPVEKRGMALGLVGGVYGIANILGSSAGSAILDLFGKDRWDLLFLINVPIAVLIIAFGIFLLPSSRGETVRRIDYAGIPVLTAMVLSLLYGLRNVDFFDFAHSLAQNDVYPFLLLFVALLPVLLLVERRAEDPVLALSYFTDRRTLIPLVLSFFVGVMMMGMVFVPQFSENSLHIPSGSGGYFVAVLGLFAGLSGPLSGTLVDRFGPRRILGTGFLITLGGVLFLNLVTIPTPSWASVLVSLAVIGLGLGFTMGTPLNYMMLQNTRREDSNSALATLSLIRSVGTAIAPAIMVGFLAHAGMNVQADLTPLLPKVEAPKLVQADVLQRELDALRADPASAAMLEGLSLPTFDLSETTDFGSMTAGDAAGEGIPASLLESLKTADITTITDRMKDFSAYMFDAKTPAVVGNIRAGIASGIAGTGKAIEGMDGKIADMQAALVGIDQGIAGLRQGIAGVRAALADPVVPAARAGLEARLADLESQLGAAEGQRTGLSAGLSGVRAGRARLVELSDTMKALDAEVPVAFAQARSDYLAAIEARRDEFEESFQATLNDGFRQMFLTVGVASVLALLILLLYRPARKGSVPATDPQPSVEPSAV